MHVIRRALLRALPVLAGGLLALALAAPMPPPAARAATAIVTIDDAEAALLRGLNTERTKAGLVPLRIDSTLMRIAGERSANMVRNDYFGHVEPDGDTFVDYLDAAGTTWYSGGEVIASDRYPGLDYSVGVTRWGWMNSPSHRAQVLSDDANYIGVGLAMTSVGIHRWTAIILRMPDHTGGWVDPGSPSLSATTAGRRTMSLPFAAADRKLQALTAGLRDVEIQRRTDGGAWTSLGWTTGATIRRTLDVGRRYEFRFRARDRRLNVGGWSDIVTVRP